MKYLYVYNNNSQCNVDNIDINNIDNIEGVFHSKIVTLKTMLKDKGNNKYVHIFKRYKNDIYKYTTTLIIS